MKNEHLEKRILQATILVASGYDPYRFSTAEIAEKIGTSEFEIYRIYGNKEGLIKACRVAIEEDFFTRTVQAMKEHRNFEETFNLLLDYYIAHPDAIRFALTYDYVFPHRVLPADFPEYKAEVIEKLVKPLDEIRSSKERDLETRYQLTDHWVRELVVFAELILDGVVQDTPKNRRLMVQTINHGIFSFPKAPGTPD